MKTLTIIRVVLIISIIFFFVGILFYLAGYTLFGLLVIASLLGIYGSLSVPFEYEEKVE